MPEYAEPVARLIEELQKLPGIGARSAQRLAFFIMRTSSADANKLASAIKEVKEKIRFCDLCFNITDKAICSICASEKRDHHVICVVEEPKDVLAIERTSGFSGLYHVLQGAISPLDGIGPEKLRIRELLDRIRSGGVTEVIVATNPTIEGETTAMYLSKLLHPLEVKVTRLASGLPVGSDLDYADEITLSRAFEGRREI